MKKWILGLSVTDKVMVIGMSVVLVVASASLIYGILTHKEPGLLTSCDTPTGVLDPDGDCFEVKWDQSQFPLKVYLSSSNPFAPEDPISARNLAVSWVNTQLRFRALTYTSDRNTADILIDFEAAQEVSSMRIRNPTGGIRHRRKANGQLWCEVHTWNSGTPDLADKALVHELGHCLGLAHDPFSSSAMFPTIRRTGTPARLRFTDHDVALLYELYH